jgi:methylated-DNA-[protein]-cysteine S-methyltransferase
MKFNPPTYQTHMETPLGRMLLAASPRGLRGAWFVQGQRHMPDTTGWIAAPDHPVLQQARAELNRYFAGEPVAFSVDLDLDSGTVFQQTVWRALLDIARGSTTSYGQLSARIGKPKAVRALGGAVGHNPLSIIVPCHRVIGADGSLTGYAGGLERKIALLRLEIADCADLFFA